MMGMFTIHQIIAVILIICILLFWIFIAVYNRKLSVSLGILWSFFATAGLALVLFPALLKIMMSIFSISSPVNMFLLCIFFATVVLLLYISYKISDRDRKLIDTIRAVALLGLPLRELEKSITKDNVQQKDSKSSIEGTCS